MNINQLKPAREFASRYGVKCLAYGPPGSGKTPLINTAPRPVLCVVEPGMLSMRNSNVPAFEADTPAKFDEFFKWLTETKEAAAFDTIGIDSISQLAEIILREEEKKNSHGLKAYGNMAERVYDYLHKLYYLPNKHIYLIGKQETYTTDSGSMRRPYFPGKELNVKVPHLFDEILHIAVANIPGAGQHKCIRTAATFDIMARDRSGNLAEFEPLDLTALFNKAMM